MIGLEYILKVYNVQQTDLADELGIRKQNITLWLRGKQNISRKYLPILSEKFNIPIEYFQKEVTELDKKYIEKRQLDEYIEKTAVEYEDAIWDESTNDYVSITRTHYDTGAIEHYRMIEAEEKEIKTINKIKSTINDINDFYLFDTHIDMYERNIEIFDRFTDIISAKTFNDGFVFEVLRALELCVPEISKKHHIWGKGRKNSALVEDDRPMTQELFKILDKYLKMENEKIQKRQKEDADFIEEMKELGLYSDEDFEE